MLGAGDFSLFFELMLVRETKELELGIIMHTGNRNGEYDSYKIQIHNTCKTSRFQRGTKIIDKDIAKGIGRQLRVTSDSQDAKFEVGWMQH